MFMGMEVSWIPSDDIDLHDSLVKSDTWNINDYKGASLLWGKDAKPPLVIVCPALLLLLLCSALHPQQGQAWTCGEHIIAIWTSIFESDGIDNLKQGTLWRSTHDDCWCATQGMRNKSKESTNILTTIIRTSGCWYNTTMSGACCTPAPKSCLSIQENVSLLQTIDSVYKNCEHKFILQLWCSLVF
jgi:hypothetical protein